jgi:hypothetical protein
VPGVECEDKTNGVQTKGTCIACTSNTFPLRVSGVDLAVRAEEVGGSGECNGSKENWASHLGPQLEGGVGSNGPSILRTMKGDLPLIGLHRSNPFLQEVGSAVIIEGGP